MRIHLHIPRTELRPFVEYIWVLDSTPGRETHFPRIPPFGEVELAFHVQDPFQYQDLAQSPRSVPAAHISGPRTRYFDLLPGDRVGFLSVRFRPGAYHYFYPGSLAELTNNVIALEDLHGPEILFTLERIREARDTATRIGIIEEYLMECLRSRESPDLFIQGAMSGLTRSILTETAAEPGIAFESGGRATDFLAESLGLSRRTFQRRFKNAFGMSARDYRRLLRFEAMLKDTLRRRAAGDHAELGEQALRFGWFDQSHFNKDFREYMGLAPSDFLRSHGDGLIAIV